MHCAGWSHIPTVRKYFAFTGFIVLIVMLFSFLCISIAFRADASVIIHVSNHLSNQFKLFRYQGLKVTSKFILGFNQAIAKLGK
jgi:hypothetical protein